MNKKKKKAKKAQEEARATGWICPICGDGVSPDLAICPNNHRTQPLQWFPLIPNTTTTTNYPAHPSASCPCRPENGGSGICGCYRPGKDGFTFTS